MTRPSPSIRAPFFRSSLQAALLARLVDQADSWTTIGDLEAFGGSHQVVRKEIARLVDAGIVERETSSRPHRFRFAADGPLAPSLSELVRRTVGVEPRLRDALAGLPDVTAAAIYGSWATGSIGPSSDIDVLVLLSPDAPGEVVQDVYDIARECADVFGRDVDAMVYTEPEARAKLANGSGYLASVLAGARVSLIGDVDEALAARQGA